MSVTLHTTLGPIKIELFINEAPQNCANFLALCASHYYDHNKFHRIVKNFMTQTGDPTGKGNGGESIFKTPIPDEIYPQYNLKHDTRGIVSMANRGKDMNMSQFFITFAAAPHLDNMYTIFGKVIDGFETLDRLENIPVRENDTKFRPLQDIFIESVTIHANPIAQGNNQLIKQ
jgi:peptidyl-prolyl cis-trans isomerase-like 3